jgi:hypothetical protein
VVSIEILASNGDIIRSFTTDSKEKGDKLITKEGGNQFIWDMRYPGFKEFDGMILYSSPNRGPKAVPGDYKVRLTVNGEAMEQPCKIIPDPRLPNTMEDYQKQFDFLMSVRDRVSEAHQAIIDIRATRDDLDYLREKIGSDVQMEDLKQLADQLDEQI